MKLRRTENGESHCEYEEPEIGGYTAYTRNYESGAEETIQRRRNEAVAFFHLPQDKRGRVVVLCIFINK